MGLIQTLNEAVLHPESLNGFCARLKDVTSCHLGALFLQDHLRPGGTYLASDGFDQALTDRYDLDFASKNILMERAMRDMRPGLVCVSEQHVSDSEWEMSDYYNGFAKPHDTFYVAGGCIAYDYGVSAMVTLGRSRNAGSFEISQLALIGSLLPHLRNAMEIQRSLGFLELSSERG